MDMEKLCEEKHKVINGRLEVIEDDVKMLQKSDAVNSTEIKNLCNQIGSQTKAIWGLVSMTFASMVGFVVWYIQSLPR